MKRMAAIAILLFVAGCAAGSGGPAANFTTHIVKSANGDRVTVRVEGNAERGFTYRAELAGDRRDGLDSAERRGILNDAMRSVMLVGCGSSNPYKPGNAAYASGFTERIGRFSCAGR